MLLRKIDNLTVKSWILPVEIENYVWFGGSFGAKSNKKRQSMGIFPFVDKRNLSTNVQRHLKIAIDCNQKPQRHKK